MQSLKNRDSARRTVLVRKPEAEVDLVESVTVNGERADFSYVHGAVQFCVHVPAGQTVEIHCAINGKPLRPAKLWNLSPDASGSLLGATFLNSATTTSRATTRFFVPLRLPAAFSDENCKTNWVPVIDGKGVLDRDSAGTDYPR